MTQPLLLIADDDADMRSLVRSTLQRDYPDALELTDGRELFWHLLRASFSGTRQAREHIMIVDIRMPGYTGLEVLDAWHGEEEAMPCIVITSFPDDAVRDKVAQLDATLVAKPFTRRALREAVRATTQRMRRRKGASQ